MTSPKKILVGLDLQKSDSALIEQAILYANAFKASVWMVHVTSSTGDDLIKEASPKPVSQLTEPEMTKAQKEISAHCQAVLERDISCDGQLITGSATNILLSEIDQLKADLLIIGEKKHGAVYKALIGGSTSSKILKEIHIPVLIVPIAEN